MLKCECATCGYTVRTARKWLEQAGAPLCPIEDHGQMEHEPLDDEGVLMIAVPNYQSLDGQKYGAHWAAYDVPRHLSHFRRADVHAFLAEHGFELIATRGMWMDAFYIALLSERYRGTTGLLALIKAVVVGGWSNVLALLGKRPTSSSLYLARKLEL